MPSQTQLSQSNVNSKQAQAQVNPQQGKSKGRVILLIEDDPVLSKMYTEKFKREGFTVLTAQDGQTGLKLALSEKIDLILLDIMLPRISGIDLLEQLRSDPRGKTINVLALSNLADPQEKEKALKLGVKEYLVKAMQTPEQVVGKIKNYISS